MEKLFKPPASRRRFAGANQHHRWSPVSNGLKAMPADLMLSLGIKYLNHKLRRGWWWFSYLVTQYFIFRYFSCQEEDAGEERLYFFYLKIFKQRSGESLSKSEPAQAAWCCRYLISVCYCCPDADEALNFISLFGHGHNYFMKFGQSYLLIDLEKPTFDESLASTICLRLYAGIDALFFSL